MKAKTYQYSECGLDHVFIEGMDVVHDDHGEETYTIPNILGLHKLIAQAIVSNRSRGMTGSELRFLRTEIGFTSEEAAERVGRDIATLEEWERQDAPIDPAAAIVLKRLAAEKLRIDSNMTVEQMSKSSPWSVTTGDIRIDGSDPIDYKLVA